jgi:hypothetical protein
MPRKYPYYPSFNGGGEKKVTAKLVELCARRWQTKSLGTYSLRLMRNDHTKNMKIGDAGYEKYLSVHATVLQQISNIKMKRKQGRCGIGF